jgi:hypothetical protein
MDYNKLGISEDLINAVKSVVSEKKLHPNQEKLDKNKNGKLDADDFKKLRGESACDEEVDMGQADRTLRTKSSSTKNTYHVKNKANKIISTHDNQSSAIRAALKHDDHKVVKEEVESTNQHYVMAHNRARGVSSIVKKDGEHHLHPSKEAASEHAGKLNAKSSSPHVYYTYGGNIKEAAEELDEVNKFVNVASSKRAIADAEKALNDNPNMFHGAKTGFKRQITIHKKHIENASKNMKEEVEELDERNKENATRRKMMDASRGARWKVQNKMSGDDVRDWDGKHKNPQAQNKAIGRALRNEEVEELYLEDYSLEEIQDFMMSEDFEQLDELSKKTLGSYVSKSHDQLMKHTGTVNMKYGRGDKDATAYALDKDALRKTANRTQGLTRAISKLAKEEFELTQEQYEEIEALAAKHGLGE